MEFRIVKNPGRNQPFTIWINDMVDRFCITRAEAEQFVRRRNQYDLPVYWESPRYISGGVAPLRHDD